MKRVKQIFLPAVVLLIAGCGATTKSASVKENNASSVAIVETQKNENTIAMIPEEIQEKTQEKIESKVIEKEQGKPVPIPRRPMPEVDILMGKTVAEIKQVFGHPVLQRVDKPAEVWQYLTGDCALHLVFYPTKEASKKGLIVHHVSMNDRRKATPVDAKKCFSSQLRRVGEDRARVLS